MIGEALSGEGQLIGIQLHYLLLRWALEYRESLLHLQHAAYLAKHYDFALRQGFGMSGTFAGRAVTRGHQIMTRYLGTEE